MEKNNMDHKIHVFHLLAVHFANKNAKKFVKKDSFD